MEKINIFKVFLVFQVRGFYSLVHDTIDVVLKDITYSKRVNFTFTTDPGCHPLGGYCGLIFIPGLGDVVHGFSLAVVHIRLRWWYLVPGLGDVVRGLPLEVVHIRLWWWYLVSGVCGVTCRPTGPTGGGLQSGSQTWLNDNEGIAFTSRCSK